MADNENKRRACLLDENKICDDCGECDRCDLDPNKICDNCCKCLALEDGDDEFRTVTLDGKTGEARYKAGASKSAPAKKTGESAVPMPSAEEPYELTPELVEYWEQKLMEYGEAPAEDGFGEIAVSERVPVKGVRKRSERHAHKH